MNKSIKQLIGETTEYDKKEKLEVKRPKSWCKSVSAFANGSGGCLIFGIADNGEVVGLVKPQETAEKFSEIVKTKLDPVPEYSFSFETVDEKVVLVVRIESGELTPYYYIGDGQQIAFRRSGNESLPASAIKLRELVLKGSHQSFDSLPTKYDFNDYSFTKLRATFHARTGKQFTEEDYNSWGIIDNKGNLTNAGALLADECPIRYARVFCTRWNGITKAHGLKDALDDMEISGSLVLQLQDALSFCRRNIRKMWYKTGDGRVELPDYPEDSILEALVNGLIHRSYLEFGSEVHVDIFDDRIEIFSPGSMFESKPVQEHDIMHVQSRRRNPTLADIFSRLHYMERRGSGFRKMCQDYEAQKNYREELRPKFFSNETDFVVTLYNLNYQRSEEDLMNDALHHSLHQLHHSDENVPNDVPKVSQSIPNLIPMSPNMSPNGGDGVSQSIPKYPKVSQTQLPDNLYRFLRVLRNFPGATVRQLTEEAQLSEGMIKRHLSKLKELGIIKRVGTNRLGYWQINIDKNEEQAE